MDIEFFNEYLNYQNNGIKLKAKEYVIKFINSFEGNFKEKELWTLEYLPKLEKNHHSRIRNEIFEEIVFPVLLNGYNNKNIELMIWLVRLSQNYYQNTKIWEKINYKSDLQLLKECYDLEPNNTEVLDLFLELEMDQIGFRIHEWPTGVLCGMNFATKEECKKMLEQIPFLHKLDRKNEYLEYVSDYENKKIYG